MASAVGESGAGVAKMASHAIFQYIVLAIDDTHNTWTNMIVKIIILRFLGSSDDKEPMNPYLYKQVKKMNKCLKEINSMGYMVFLKDGPH